jgi:hypothetical protein
MEIVNHVIPHVVGNHVVVEILIGNRTHLSEIMHNRQIELKTHPVNLKQLDSPPVALIRGLYNQKREGRYIRVCARGQDKTPHARIPKKPD